MARIRTIKPETPEDEKLGRVSRDARLLFILLWTLCDDHGRFRASPTWLRNQLFGYDNDVDGETVTRWLGELEAIGAVQGYEASGETYGVVVNWAKHQRIDNAGKAMHPEPPPGAGASPQFAASLGEPPKDAAGPGPGPGPGKDRASDPPAENGKRPPNPSSTASGGRSLDEGFDQFWQAYPRKVERQKALRAWKARRREGIPASELGSAGQNYADRCRQAQTDKQFVKHGATFLGPDRLWQDFLDDGEAMTEPIQTDDRYSDDPATRAAAYGTFIADRTRPAWMDVKDA